MRSEFSGLTVVLAALVMVLAACVAAAGQGAGYTGPRTPEGRPDLNGIWQAFTTASWNIEAHSAQEGVPAGAGDRGGWCSPVPAFDAGSQAGERRASRRT